jgi:hypothetical protein
VVHACNPSYLGGGGRRISTSRLAQTQLMKPCLKKKKKSQELESVYNTMGANMNDEKWEKKF